MGIKERRLREKEEVRSTILTAGWRLGEGGRVGVIIDSQNSGRY
jgi:hypothetical protein